MVTTDAPERTDIRSTDTEVLRRRLAEQIEITARSVQEMALIWRELERRGEDLASLRTGLGQYLGAVAQGRLLPEAVVRLAGNRPALRALSLLSTHEQRRLLDAGTVAVLRGEEPENVPIHRLTQSDITRAIDTVDGRIREVSEQRAPRIRAKRTTTPRRVVVPLSQDQYDALQAAAARSKTSASGLVLRLLVDGGVLR